MFTGREKNVLLLHKCDLQAKWKGLYKIAAKAEPAIEMTHRKATKTIPYTFIKKVQVTGIKWKLLALAGTQTTYHSYLDVQT